MLAAGELVNVGTVKNFALWHRDDPARLTLDYGVSEEGHASDITLSATGDEAETGRVSPCPYVSRDTGLGTRPGSTSPGTSEDDDGSLDEDIRF
jgi:hypothetical protein